MKQTDTNNKQMSREDRESIIEELKDAVRNAEYKSDQLRRENKQLSERVKELEAALETLVQFTDSKQVGYKAAKKALNK